MTAPPPEPSRGCRVCQTQDAGLPTLGYIHDKGCPKRERSEEERLAREPLPSSANESDSVGSTVFGTAGEEAEKSAAVEILTQVEMVRHHSSNVDCFHAGEDPSKPCPLAVTHRERSLVIIASALRTYAASQVRTRDAEWVDALWPDHPDTPLGPDECREEIPVERYKASGPYEAKALDLATDSLLALPYPEVVKIAAIVRNGAAWLRTAVERAEKAESDLAARRRICEEAESAES